MTDRIGRYEVLSHLASGGMGSVYLARSVGPAGFERHVVLKMLEMHFDDAAIAMFLDEACLIGRMHHQHIATTHELDRDADGNYFLVSDYIHGQTAKDVWTRTTELGLELPLNFTVTVAMAAASALRYAHALKSRDGKPLGIVHRDVSLSNLMIGYDGAIKLIDFGIAKAAQRTSVSRVGEIKGKPSYMAPEQTAGDTLDHRADIFTLGIVLYELATMKRAFRDRTDYETILRIQRGDVVPPSQVVDGFPADLERIILTALAVAPAERYRDAEAMRRELEEFARRRNLVVGDPAIVSVMEVLFEDRDEPWVISGGVVAGDDDDAVTDPIEMLELAEVMVSTPVTIEPRARSRARGPTAVTPAVVEPSGASRARRPTADMPLLVEPSGPSRARRPTADTLALVTPFQKPRIADDVITQPLAMPLSAAAEQPLSDATTGSSATPVPGASARSIATPFPGASARSIATPVPGATTISTPPPAPPPRSLFTPAPGATMRSIVTPFSISIRSPELPFSGIDPLAAPTEYPLGSSSFTAVGPPAPGRWKWVAAAGLAMAVIALTATAFAIGARLLRGNDRSDVRGDAPGAVRGDVRSANAMSASATRTSVPSRPIVTPIDAGPAPAPTTVWLRITTTPDDATVLLDGNRLGRTPFAGEFPADGGVHKLKIRRRGYAPQWLEIDMSHDVTREIELRELRKAADPALATNGIADPF